jgi:hypothetical protein
VRKKYYKITYATNKQICCFNSALKTVLPRGVHLATQVNNVEFSSDLWVESSNAFSYTIILGFEYFFYQSFVGLL